MRGSAGRAGRLASVTAAVLLGGESSRMGRDKARIEVAGRPAALHLAQQLDDLFAEVLLVGGHPPGSAPGRPVADPEGPGCALRGVLGALEAATTDKLFVVATDHLALTPDLVLGLIAQPEADAVVPRRDGRLQPLCALYRREPALAQARKCWTAGELSLRDLLMGLDVHVFEGADLAAVDPGGLSLSNANTPEELEALRERLAALPS